MRDFVIHRTRPLLGTVPPEDTTKKCPSYPVPAGIFYFTPGVLPLRPFRRIGACPHAFSILGAMPPRLSNLLEIHFLPLQGFAHDGLDHHWSPKAFSSSRLPHFDALTSVVLPHGPCPCCFGHLSASPILS
jgi:hypothetical protein